jgi:hypothetical protein
MTNLEHYLRVAASGRSVLIVQEGVMRLSARVNSGALFIRGHSLTSLRSISVDTAVFFGQTPRDVYLAASERTSGQIDARIKIHDSQETLCSEYLMATH